ncbi:MAG: hypothetical protein AAF438_24210, partial [Pseudomonadota bacterium]
MEDKILETKIIMKLEKAKFAVIFSTLFFLGVDIFPNASFGQEPGIISIPVSSLSNSEDNFWKLGMADQLSMQSSHLCSFLIPTDMNVMPGTIVSLKGDTCWTALDLELGSNSIIVTNGYEFTIFANQLIVEDGAKVQSFHSLEQLVVSSPPAGGGYSFPKGVMAPNGTNGRPGGSGSKGEVAPSTVTGTTPSPIAIYVHETATGFLEIRNFGGDAIGKNYVGGKGGSGGRGEQGGRSVTKKVLGVCTCASGPGFGGMGGAAGYGGDASEIALGGGGGEIEVMMSDGAEVSDFLVFVDVLGGAAAVSAPGLPGKPGKGGLGGRGSCGCRGAVQSRRGSLGLEGETGRASDFYLDPTGEQTGIPRLLCDQRSAAGRHNLVDQPIFLGEADYPECKSYCEVEDDVLLPQPITISPEEWAKQVVYAFWSNLASALKGEIVIRKFINHTGDPYILIEDP